MRGYLAAANIHGDRYLMRRARGSVQVIFAPEFGDERFEPSSCRSLRSRPPKQRLRSRTPQSLITPELLPSQSSSPAPRLNTDSQAAAHSSMGRSARSVPATTVNGEWQVSKPGHSSEADRLRDEEGLTTGSRVRPRFRAYVAGDCPYGPEPNQMQNVLPEKHHLPRAVRFAANETFDKLLERPPRILTASQHDEFEKQEPCFHPPSPIAGR